MRDAHGRVGRVHRLTARAGRAVDVDLQVPVLDRDVDLLDLGHHGDGGRRGVDPALGLGCGNTLDAMGAAFPLEHRVGAVALDREHGLLHAAPVALAHREHLRPVPAPLRVALQHAGHFPRPERRLVASDALPDLDDHVLRVRGVALDEGHSQLVLEARDLALELTGHRGELGIALRVDQVGARLPPLPCGAQGRLELLQTAADVRGLATVGVDGRVGQTFLELGVRPLELVGQCFQRRHRATKSRCAARRVPMRRRASPRGRPRGCR